MDEARSFLSSKMTVVTESRSESQEAAGGNGFQRFHCVSISLRCSRQGITVALTAMDGVLWAIVVMVMIKPLAMTTSLLGLAMEIKPLGVFMVSVL